MNEEVNEVVGQEVEEQGQNDGCGGDPDVGECPSAPVYDDEVQNLINLINNCAPDAQKCLTEKNKSAGRRARKVLLEIGKLVKPLRKRLSDVTSPKE